MSRHFCYFCVHYTEHSNPNTTLWTYGSDWTCSTEFEGKEDAIANQGRTCSCFSEGKWKHRRAVICEYTFSNGRKLSVIQGSRLSKND